MAAEIAFPFTVKAGLLYRGEEVLKCEIHEILGNKKVACWCLLESELHGVTEEEASGFSRRTGRSAAVFLTKRGWPSRKYISARTIAAMSFRSSAPHDLTDFSMSSEKMEKRSRSLKGYVTVCAGWIRYASSIQA